MLLEVMIADDHAIVCSGLSRLLESQDKYIVTATASSGEELMVLCKNKLPDLVIADLSMPGMGGIELVRRLLVKWPLLNIAVFSIYQNPYLVNRLIDMGVKGYISKSSDTDTILSCIDAVSNGRNYISADIEKSAASPRPLSTLSAREFDIFCCIAEGLGTKHASKKLFLSEKTIANNISIIKKKLNISSTTEMVHLAISEGLLIVE